METNIKSSEQQEKVEKDRLLSINIYFIEIINFIFAKKVVTFKSFFLNFLQLIQ
jgi:hypothetical protein